MTSAEEKQKAIINKAKAETFVGTIDISKQLLAQRVAKLNDSLIDFRDKRREEEGLLIEARKRLQACKDDELACSTRIDEITTQIQNLENLKEVKN